MIKFISRSLITGLITLLPAVLSVYLFYWLAVTSERFLGSALKLVVPDNVYFPGMGTLAGFLAILAVGVLMNAYFIRQLFAMWEQLLYRLPLFRSVYSALRELIDYFAPKKEDGLGEVVAVNINGMELIGFVTQNDSGVLPGDLRQEGKVLVYLPMSYQVGGYTIVVSRESLKPLDMSRDEAMRFVLTAGITAKQ